MSASLRLALLLLVAAAAAAGGFAAYRWHGKKDFPTQQRMAKSLISRPLPDVTLPDLESTHRKLSEWKGRPLLINFWATWCEPCRREIPLLETIRREHAAEGLEVVGIAVDFKDAVASYVRSAGISYPVLVAEQDALIQNAFGLGTGIPVTLFAGRDGHIVAVHVGRLREERATKLVKRTLAAP